MLGLRMYIRFNLKNKRSVGVVKSTFHIALTTWLHHCRRRVIEILVQGNQQKLNLLPDKQPTATSFWFIRPLINSVVQKPIRVPWKKRINCSSDEAESQSGGAYRTIRGRSRKYRTNLNPMRPCALNIATTGCMAMRRITARSSLLLFKSAGISHPSG